MENCQNCGAPLSGQPFCTSCGTPVAAADPDATVIKPVPPTQPLPTSGPGAFPPPGAPGPGGPGPGGPGSGFPPPPGAFGAPPTGGGGPNKLLLVILAIVGVLILAGGGVAAALMLTGDDKKDDDTKDEGSEATLEDWCEVAVDLNTVFQGDHLDEAKELAGDIEEMELPDEFEDVEEGYEVVLDFVQEQDSLGEAYAAYEDLDDDEREAFDDFLEELDSTCDSETSPSVTTTAASDLEGFCEVSVELDEAGDENDLEGMRSAFEELDSLGLPSELSEWQEGFELMGQLVNDADDMDDLESSYLDMEAAEMAAITEYFENLETECEAIGVHPDDVEPSATTPDEPTTSATPESPPSDAFEDMPTCTDYTEPTCKAEWDEYFESYSSS